MNDRKPDDGIDPVQVAPDRSIEPQGVDAVVPTTMLKPPPGAGLTMVDGDAVGVCEGDACFVPSWVRKHDAG